jgi:hypothetical protein
MTALAIACPACDRPNAAHRGYCGGCGAVLQPVCRGCRFVNDGGDVYCGGCGNQLVTPGAAVIVSRAASSGPVSAMTMATAMGNDELAELFVAAAPAQAELPQNITQGDLDRLFGGGQ